MKRYFTAKRRPRPDFHTLSHSHAPSHRERPAQRRPDFCTLDQPKHTKIREFFSLLIFFFFLVSVAGFFWEVLIFLVKEGQFRKRGFFYGPWLPIYGVGATLIYILLGGWRTGHDSSYANENRHHSKNEHFSQNTRQNIAYPFFVFLISAILGTGVELLIGWTLHHFWNLRYWDYSDYFLNFHGYICFWSVLGFGTAGTIWICLLAHFFAGLWFRIPKKVRRNINTLLVLLFLLDFAAALILPNMGNGVTFP